MSKKEYKLLEKGTRVRIGLDLTLSYQRYGNCSSGAMERMKGKVLPISHDSIGDRVKIYSEEKDFHFNFTRDNISIASGKKKRIPKQLFDPATLDI